MSLRRAAPYVGGAVALTCVALLAWRVSQLFAELAPFFSDGATLVGLLGFATVYALSLFLVAFAWLLLIPRDGAAPSTRALIRVYGVTSIANVGM